MIKKDIIFAGVGGQGVLTASEICSQVAIAEGYSVKRSDIRGLSQRGGAVESQLRIGRDIYSPIIMPKTADFIISFDSTLTSKIRRKYLSPTGVDLSGAINGIVLDNMQKRSLNIFMLGILSVHLPFDNTTWKRVIRRTVKKKYEIAIAMFDMGASLNL